MKNNILIIGIILVAIGLVGGYAFRGSYNGSMSGHMMSDGSMMGQNIDQHFIVQMIPHHEGAIEMAKIALERSTHPEVLALSKGIIEAQEKEITDMTSWYVNWFGEQPVLGGMSHMHMDGMTGDVSVLNTISAKDFDKEFISQMIPHHEMAVMMAEMLASATNRSEMKELAKNIIASQSQEIEMMRGWLKSW